MKPTTWPIGRMILIAGLSLQVGCGEHDDPYKNLLKQVAGKWDGVNTWQHFNIQPDGEVQEINDETKEVVAFGTLKMESPDSLKVRLSSNARFEFRPAGNDYLAVRIWDAENKQQGGGFVLERMSSDASGTKTPPVTPPPSEKVKEPSPKEPSRDSEASGEPSREKTPTGTGNKDTPTQVTYRTFKGEKTTLYAWTGQHVAFLTIRQDLDPSIMTKLCATFDKVYNFYVHTTGTTPKPRGLHDGRVSIAEVENTCGAGCGHLGATGIELMPQSFQLLYDGVKERDAYDQVLPYEFGRNFWFYSDQLGYRDGDKDNAVVTGYAVFMRFAAIEAAGVALGPFRGRSGTDFRNEVIRLVDLYEADPSLTWDNTIKIDRAPANPMQLNGTDLFAGFCFQLAKQHGGPVFVRQLWQEVAKRPRANTTQQAVDNFVVAASKAAGKDLADLFATTWRWPISSEARQEVRSNAVAVAAFPEETKGTTSLTPEEAEKLICTDTKCRTVQKTARYTVQIPYTEQTTQPNGMKVNATKYRTEERERTFTVTKCGGEDLVLNTLTDLSAETASVLARHQGTLTLDGLTDLTPEVAKLLAACSANLSLKGLTTLTPETAKHLAARTAGTDLSGLKELSPDVAKSLSACPSGWLILNGLAALTPDVAKPLAACSANVGLKGLTTLTPEIARILAARKANTDLGGLRELSPDIAEYLSACSAEGFCLNGLETLPPDVAQALAKCPCYLSLGGLHELPPESAKALAGYRGRGLYLDGVKQITLEDAKGLAATSGSLSLGGLTTVPYEVAEVLCDRSGKLSLNGLQRVDRATFEVLYRKQALPHSVAVDKANSRIVVWKRKGAVPLAEIRQTISEAVGMPINIEERVIESLGTSLQDATATPPNRVMDASQAVQWLGQQLSKGPPVQTQWSDKEVNLSASDKNPDPSSKGPAPAETSAESPAAKDPVIDQKALRKAFGASRASYDNKTGILTLAYDFSRPEQLKDWESSGNQPTRTNGGKVVRVGAAESLVHRAVLMAGTCDFRYALTDVPDKGPVVSAGKVATVTQTEWNRRRYFTLNGREASFDPRDKHASVEDANALQFQVSLLVGAERCSLAVNGAETAVPRRNEGTFQFAFNGGDNGGAFASAVITGKPDMKWLMKALGKEDTN